MLHDVVVIGAGILGLSTAMQLLEQFPGIKVRVLEKESGSAKHQTGNNSGVIHAGVYYTPGSLKANFCLEGNKLTKAFCEKWNIPFDSCGKLLVATNDLEMQRMQALWERTEANGLERYWLSAEELHAREPNITGVGAIFVPSSGIVNYAQICEAMAKQIRELGGEITFDAQVTALHESSETIKIETTQQSYNTRYLISCGGLMSDRIVRMLGVEPDFKICPFRGEYFRLAAKHNNIVNHLIYPIPDPSMPFLGVHLTRMIDGSVTVGPNAVLAFKREGYNKTDFSLRDSFENLSYPGTLKLLYKNLKPGLHELKNSLFKAGYLKEVNKYCPSLKLEDLEPYPAGVRAQAVSPDGRMIDDFKFVHTKRSINVCNAPSPAATSSLPIGQHIVKLASEQFSLGARQAQ
ncbi:MAG: L-2-hydroxyglutarate oxidase [Oceanospirillaceae bacterium]|nr:L-2-hydroxyglutarate oxidase [Oceanospirillaceae bacterium]